ncbi:MAG: hypothetical protein ACREI9_06065 [Nitrospiraceae bacterium]
MIVVDVGVVTVVDAVVLLELDEEELELEELDDEVPPPPEPLVPGGVRLDGDDTGAVPPEAIAICLGLSLFGLSLTSVPWTAFVTCDGALFVVLTVGVDGGPPPGGVTENCPGGTVMLRPPEKNSTWPWLPTLTMPLTPFM